MELVKKSSEDKKCMEERSGLGLFLNRNFVRESVCRESNNNEMNIDQVRERGIRHTVLLFVSPNWG